MSQPTAEVPEVFLADDYTGSQVFEMMRGGTASAGRLVGERRLQMAMIELAIADISGTRSRRERHGHSAISWVMAAYDSTRFPDVKSFEGCCQSLGLDPVGLRSAILALHPGQRRARELSHGIDRDEDRRLHRRRARIVSIGAAA